MDLDRKAAAWAERRHGLIRADVAARMGFSRGHIQHRVRTGRWELVRERVYRITGSPPTWDQQLLAATWSSNANALASHSSALRLWGLGADDHLEIVTDRAHQVRLPGVIGHRSLALPQDDQTRRRNIPVTSMARTLVDLSGRMTCDELGALIDAALRARLLRLEDLARCAGRLLPAPGRRLSIVQGCLELRLPGYDPGDSDLETRAVRALIHGGLPAPHQRYKVRLDGRTFVLDLAYPEQMVAMELDGFSVHRWRTPFDRDRSRKNLLEVNGWMVLQFTSRMPDDEICEMARRAIALRSGEEKKRSA